MKPLPWRIFHRGELVATAESYVVAARTATMYGAETRVTFRGWDAGHIDVTGQTIHPEQLHAFAASYTEALDIGMSMADARCRAASAALYATRTRVEG